jgi:hypothetical protein
MVAPRLYLDTNTLIDSVLEPPTAGSGSSRNRERHIAQVIFANWPSTNLVVSPYVIGEFIQRGRKPPFSKTLDEMRTVVDEIVLNRCRMTFFKGDMKLAGLYDRIGVDPKWLVGLEVEGDATDKSGLMFHGLRGWLRLSRAGQVSMSVMSAGPQTPDLETTTFAVGSKVKIEAPAVELILFDTAAQLVEETGVNRKDAFHFLYASWETVDSIVTTDTEFIKRASDKYPKLPKVEKPSDVEVHSRVFPEFHKAMFG